jgi:hypothetical protein
VPLFDILKKRTKFALITVISQTKENAFRDDIFVPNPPWIG